MKISDLLTSPPPSTGWSLDTAMVVAVRRQSKTGLRGAALEVPEGTFDIGPVGLQAVDEEKLRPVLARLQQEVEGGKRASVVIPTGWVRTHLFDFEHLPRRRVDLDDMVLWRLKKLLPVPPSTLRLATVTQPADADGPRRLLVLVGVERALASLEAIFASVNVSPGMVTPRIFAVVGTCDAAEKLLSVQQERGFFSVLLLVNGQPRMVRTKPLAGSGWDVIERELVLSLGFIRSKLGVEDELMMSWSLEDADLEAPVSQWLADQESLTAAPPAVSTPVFEGTAVRDRAGAHRLDPVVGTMSGGIR